MPIGKARTAEDVEQADFADALRKFAASVDPSAANVNVRSVQKYGAGNARYCNIPDVADPQDDVMVAEFGGIVVIVPFGL